MSKTVRLLLAVPFLSVALAATGCRPAGEAYTYLQYLGGKTGLGRTTMTITHGDGRLNARNLVKSAPCPYAHEIGNVTVRYPEGCRQTAEQVARAFADTANLAALKMGIEWSFPLELRLVRMPAGTTGLTYSVRLDRHKPVVFPIFMDAQDRVLASWAPVVAHEMTEASMLAPLDRRKMVLGDAFAGPLCIGTGTRWFRDGVAERASYLLGSRLYGERYQPDPRGYADLARTGDALLSWENSPGAPDYYAASGALMIEAENVAGDRAIAQVMESLSRESVPGGRYLRRAFEHGAGIRLPDDLIGYAPPWLGADVADTAPDTANPPLVLEGNHVVISRVYPRSPAFRWKLREGDVVVSVDGEPIGSAREFGHLIARHKPGEYAIMELRRGVETTEKRVKLTFSNSKFKIPN